MKTAADVLAFSIRSSRDMVAAMCADLTGAEWTARPTEKANCAAWTVGHLVLSDRAALGRVGVTDLPPLPDGFEARFSRENNAPASSDFGDVSGLIPLFVRHRNQLAEVAAKLPVEAIDSPLAKPHPRFATVGELLAFIALHATLHAGQISTIRRCLGRPPLF